MNINEAKPRRLTLRGWASLDDIRRRISDRVDEGKWSSIPDLIFETIELTGKVNRDSPWFDIVKLYSEILELNTPTKKFPVLTSKEKGKPLPWEYEGRSWYFWLHLFSSSYGWSEWDIGNLDIDSALGLYQEILIDDQLHNEWEWGLSETAYSYDKGSKKMRFNRLPRPDWMRPIAGEAKPVKMYKMPAQGVPMGVVIALD
jgi:hypothetical protein